MNEKTELIKEVECALRKVHYKSSVTGYDKTFMPHHINAVIEYLTPVINKFFDENLVQNKKHIWND